ncbi:hypothetical protein DKK70_07545 [Gilliamella apicola]|uniref:Uncharacterized protein n=1 Tax=Gilliamella apicola TaxID=1196095 RepID=A0A2V4EHD0_9GAMM|nr:hypothetical protein [Gilliamella apicola]PXZ07687.1 hypothetical protein DKK70_07545 [Gilliamella apicola]
MKIKSFCLIGLFAPFLVSAQNSSFDDDVTDLLKSFTQCDRTFFSDLNKENYHQYFPIEALPTGYSKFAVKPEGKSGKKSIKFDPPIIFNGVKLESYEENSDFTNDEEQFHYWGFTTDASLEEIKKAFSWIEWEKPKNTDINIANAFFYKNGYWSQNRYVITHTKPAKGTAESLFFIGVDKDSYEMTIKCTIQGDIPIKELRRFRPDL